MSDRNTSIHRSQLKPIREDDFDATNSPSDGYVASYDEATGKFTWKSALSNIVEDATPQLGGDLDLNGNQINFNKILMVGTGMKYTTIQGAIDATDATGYTILVTPGTYSEDITYAYDKTTIIGIGGKENTTITQTSATVVDFSTKSGCVLQGFTVSVTVSNTAVGDYTITGANDGTSWSDHNLVRDCDFNYTDDGSTSQHGGYSLLINDGYWQFEYCNFSTTAVWTGASSISRWYGAYFAGDEFRFMHCTFDGDWTSWSDGSSGHTANVKFGAGVFKMWSCEITVTAPNQKFDGLKADNPTSVDLYNTKIQGTDNALYLVTGGTITSYNGIYDGGGDWANIASGVTLNSYGDTVIGGTLSNAGTANLYDTNEEGIITNAKNSGVRAYRNGDQLNLTDVTYNKVEFNAEVFDKQSEFDSTTNYRFTVTKNGLYKVYSIVYLKNVIADKEYGIAIYVNGGLRAMSFYNAPTTLRNNRLSIQISDLLDLSANDYIEIMVRPDCGANTVDISGSTDYSFVAIEKIT